MHALVWLEAAFDCIWKASWQAAVLVALVLVVQIIFGRQIAAGWRCGLWLLVVARLLLPVGPASAWSLFNWVRFESAPSTLVLWAQDDPHSVSRVTGREPVAEHSAPRATGAATNPVPAFRPLGSIAPLTAPAIRGFSRQSVIGFVWLGGALILAGLLCAQYWRFQRRLHDAVEVNDRAALRVLAEAAAAIGIKRAPQLVETTHVSSPALFGLWRVRLLLPAGFTGSLTVEEMRHVFLHEVAHLRRGDLLLNWLITALQVAHWFNPVVWFGFARLRADREVACDALALSAARGADVRNYAHTIIKLLEGCTAPQALPGLVGILENNNQMKQRIAMIAKFKAVPRWPALAVALIALVGVVALTDAQVPAGSAAAGGASRQPVAAATTAVARTVAGAAAAKSGSAPGPAGMMLRRLEPAKFPGSYGPVKVSPDGRYFVYAARSQTVLCEIATERMIKVGGSRVDSNVCFSPDATQLAFVEAKELRTMAVDGSNVRTVFAGSAFGSMWVQAWSPDGHTLAVMTGNDRRYEVSLIDAATGERRILRPADEHEPGAAAFSPDGRWLVYDRDATESGTTGDLFVIEVATGKESPLAAHQADDRLLGWSPVSNSILFSSNRRGTYGAWSIAFARGKAVGEPVLVKADLGGVQSLGFTHTGAFYFSHRQWVSDIYTLALDSEGRAAGQPVKTVERFEGLNSASSWSPDGKLLAYCSQRAPWMICILDTTTNQDRVLAEGVYGPKWSPDGRSILCLSAWGSADYKMFLIDVATGQRTAIEDGKPPRSLFQGCYQWAPDGRSFYYQYDVKKDESRIVRRDLATGAEKEVPRVGLETGGYFAVSPDGRSIVFRTYSKPANRLYVIPASGGEPKLLMEVPSNYYVPGWDTFTWSTDSRSVYVCQWQQISEAGDVTQSIKSQLVRAAVSGGKPETVIDMTRIRYPNVHPDGKRITFSAGVPRFEVWVMENFLSADRISAN